MLNVNSVNLCIGKRNVELVGDINNDDLSHIVSNVESLIDENKARRYGFSVLGSGSYSKVFGFKGYAIKRLFGDREFSNLSKCNDIQVMKDLSHLSCIPKLYAVIDNNTVVMERIRGATVANYCEYPSMYDNIEVNDEFVERWNNALLEVISNGYSPDDLHEHNVMIEEETNRPVFVDLGWFYKHGVNYNPDDTDSLRMDESYERANRWAGLVIRNYVKNNKDNN